MNPRFRKLISVMVVIFIAVCTIALITTVAQAAPAHVDKRKCVSKREFQSVNVQRTKADLEESWEVVGMGEPRDLIGMGRVVIYPRCDKLMSFPEGNSWYGVAYVGRDGQRWGRDYIWNYDPGTTDGVLTYVR